MKKIFSLIFVFIIALVLSGCTDTAPIEARLDEQELQLGELQNEIIAKDFVIDSMIENIVNLNKNIYDDTSVMELIADLQLWQDEHDDNYASVLEAITMLQSWQDAHDEVVELNIDSDYTTPITEEFVYTGRYLSDFEIIIRPTNLCSDWTTAYYYHTEYLITFTNICPSHGGSVYINVDNIAVSYEYFINNHLEYNENDTFIYEYLGITFSEDTFPEIPE